MNSFYNPMMRMLLSQLQARNPQSFQVINQAMSNGGDPQVLLRQLMGNANPQQIQSVLNQARQYGVPDNVLSQIQNMR